MTITFRKEQYNMNNLNEFESVINNYEYIPEPTQTEEQNNGNGANTTNAKTEPNQEIKHYTGFSFADCCIQPQPIKYLIKNIIQEEAQHMIFGQSEHGKGFVIVDIAASVACPEIETWNGKKIKHGQVIYFAGEGAKGLRKRFAAWAIKRGINPENVQLSVIDETFKLDAIDTEHNIEKTIAEIRDRANNPVLIIFDTFNCYMGGEENSAKDAGIFLGLENRIKQEFHCAIMTIHHSGKSEKNESRGSSAIRAAMDIEYKVEKNGNIITLTQTKNKDNEKEKTLKFNLEQMIIPEWFDEDGEAVTSCTIELNETLTRIEATPKVKEEIKKEPPQSEKTAYETYAQAATEYGKIIEFQHKKQKIKAIAVKTKDWGKIFDENTSRPTEKATEKAFERARKLLIETKKFLIKKKIGQEEFYCLILKPMGKKDMYEATITQAIQERENDNPTFEIF